MLNFVRFPLIALLSLLCATTANAQATKEQYVACGGYYYTLSFVPPEFMHDLTEAQSRQAAFAMVMQVNPDFSAAQVAELLAESWMKLNDTLQKPYTQERVSEFRAGRDGLCRPLLKQAWCDAYGVASACDD